MIAVLALAVFIVLCISIRAEISEQRRIGRMARHYKSRNGR